jgi:hypothetical protein
MLGGYRVDDIIGIGGMAIVYRAEQLSLGRAVALKVLAPQLSHDEAFRERFRREGKHVAALDHPHVLTVHDSGEIDGRLFLAMRLVDGETLAERMQRTGLSADETLTILTPIADALDAAHGVGLVHRDVKPQNILIAASGHPYLADFGVAKGGTATLGLTGTGGFVGSVNYASPEQIRGLTASPAGDVYALAAVVYECLTGQVPFPRDTDAGVMHAHLNEPPPKLAIDAPDADQVDAVIARGMAKDPAARHASAGDLVRAAAYALAGVSPTGRRTVPTFGVPATPAVDDGLPPARLIAATDTRGSIAPGRGARPAGSNSPGSGTNAPSSGSDAPGAGTNAPGARTEAPGAGTKSPGAPADADAVAVAVAAKHRPRGRARQSDPRRGATELLTASERRARARVASPTTADQRRPPPAPRTKAAPPARLSRRVVVVVACLAVASVAATVTILRGGGSPSKPRLTLARSAPFAIRFGSPWRPTTAASAGSFALSAATSSTASAIELGTGKASLAAGTVAQSALMAGGAPPQLVSRYGQPTGQVATQVAGHPGRRYVWNLHNGQQLIVRVLPTATADLAILCSAAAADVQAIESCAGVAATATVSGVQALAAGPDVALSSKVSAALAPAATARARVDQLDPSHLRSRAAPATHIARVERAGVQALRAVAPPPRHAGAVAALATALSAESAGFAALARAADAGSTTAYALARGTIIAASARLLGATTTVSSHGIKTPQLGRLTPPGPPAIAKPGPVATTPVSTGPQQPVTTPTSQPTPTPAHHDPRTVIATPLN